MYLRALKGLEKAWGTAHPSTLDTVNNIGILYSIQGKSTEAEDMYLRALSGLEECWGAEHPSTLGIVNNLGLLYSSQGRLDEAEGMNLRALAGYENVWGAEHPSTLDTVNNLGLLYSSQGRLKEAEAMYFRALAGHEKVWGAEHSSTLNTVNNLGLLYEHQNKLAEAELMHQRALHGRERAFGPDHPSTLDVVSNLGSLYGNQGKFTEAAKLIERALNGYEKALGFNHLSTIDTANKLGNLYKEANKLEPSEKFLRRAVIGYTRLFGTEHPSTNHASKHLAYVRAIRRTSEENLDTTSESDASSIDSSFGDPSLGLSSVTSISAIFPQAKIAEFITGLAQLFRKDDDIQGTVWRALERSRDELKFDRSKIERNFSRLLRQYANELKQSSSGPREKIAAEFVRKKSHSVAIEVFQAVQPVKNLQDWTGIITNQPGEKLMLNRFMEETSIKADTGAQNRQAMNEKDGGEDIASSDGSDASNMDEIPSDHSIETVEAFMISGMPFANLKRQFRDFIERDVQPRDFPSNLSYGEGGKVQIRWQCLCGHQFQENIVEHKPGVAEEFVQHMHWNASPETQGAFNLWPWLTIILGFLRMFPAQGGQDNQLHEGWWGSWQAPGNNPSFGYRRQPSTVYRDNVADTAVVAERLSHFVCICIRHMSRAKYLHHAEATQKQPQIDDKDSTDHDMFKAIQRRYHSVRPWWKRLLFCARLSSVRYYEFRLFYNPENEVNIEEAWYDRFPENPPEGEWHYIPSKRDSTPYLLDGPLFHYVRYPDHVPPGNKYWKRIPKVRQEMSCQNDPERTGWGLVMNEEWHQTAFLICWVPIVASGAIGSGLYCFYSGKPATIGATIFGGILALVVWFYQLAQGYAKQGGLL